jgi:hypothetical protein
MNGAAISVLALLLIPASAWSFEPVTALDDPFAAPIPSCMAEGTATYPGSESLIHGPFAAIARSVPFGVDELAVTTAAAGGAFGGIGVFLGYSGTGFDLYGDECEKAGFSLPVGGGLAVGARLTRNAVRIKGFGEASAWSTDFGAVWRPSTKITAAASFENASGSRLGESKEPIDGRSRAFLAWSPSNAATLFCSVVNVRRFDPSASFGCTVEASRSLLIGAAAGNEPDRIDLLAAVSVRNVRFSWRGSFHRELGLSHGFSLAWGGAESGERNK